ncbi:MAG: NAD(P)-binding domain-containing protein [Phycisphaerae bacterium]
MTLSVEQPSRPSPAPPEQPGSHRRPNPLAWLKGYTHWLHTQWPAGAVEKLPLVNPDGSTNVSGVYVVGDLSGIPLLKLSANAGVNVIRKIHSESSFGKRNTADQDVLDVAIVGGGTSGFAAGLEAKRLGMRYAVFEAAEPFSTIVNFPKAKPIYTYPTDTPLEGELQLHEKSAVKEGLLEDLIEQTVDRGVVWEQARISHVERHGGLLHLVIPQEGQKQPRVVKAHRVVVGIGRSGNYRKLGVPGEELGKVFNRLHDPADYCHQNVLVVGGGDSALETAIALTRCGANVTLSYRKKEFNRPKPENQEQIDQLAVDATAPAQVKSSDVRQSTSAGPWLGAQPAGSLRLLMGSRVKAIREGEVDVELDDATVQTVENDTVFAMIGRDPPLDFFRKSGIKVVGDWPWTKVLSLVLILLAAVFVYHWKKGGVTIAPFWPFEQIAGIGDAWRDSNLFPYNVPDWWAGLGAAFASPANLLGTLKVSLGEPGFYYSFLYCSAVVIFGVIRIRRRKTPYVKIQTVALAMIQVVPLFLLPYILLPWVGNNGWFDGGWLRSLADSLFPVVEYGHGREYWRAFGLILAWPLFIWNVFTEQPLWGWLIISFVQTFVLIPGMIYVWGKGAYCGWICSCGALAETLGDAHRHKMPHGPFWNRFNMLGQAIMVFAFALLIFRVLGWVMGPESWPGRAFGYLFGQIPLVNYVWFVDLLWAGILGVGLYWHFSGRVWCRFACPLAALMHIYHRFSRFAILADKKKCISCNVCTSVCHQGIDVMSFANKGKPMIDPQCVRCSACVQMCPTGVLSFGQIDRKTGEAIKEDPSWLGASPVRMVEMTVGGRKMQEKGATSTPSHTQ